MKRHLTIFDILEYREKAEKVKSNAGKWKAVGRELMNKFGMEEIEAVYVIGKWDDKIFDILKKYGRKESDTVKGRLEDLFSDLDCGNHACRFVDKEDKKGQRTTGGCTCLTVLPAYLRLALEKFYEKKIK